MNESTQDASTPSAESPELPDLQALAVDLEEIDPLGLLLGWQSRLGGEWLVMLVTALGDAFVQSPGDGQVAFLDFASATLEPVCATAQQLEALLEDPEFIEHYFDPAAQAQLQAAGLQRQPDEVYALRTPATAGGQWTLGNVLLRPVQAHFQPPPV